ncbi:DUF4913 domain-containing protein [Microbacteriaceae bacterium VKM Ac-2855]|nr:DUF4913 domain-containing protein [Microbacteriaceae bacterium VKM Ac-2855]
MGDDDLFDVDERASAALVQAPPPGSTEAEPGSGHLDEERTTFYGSTDEWVRKFLLPIYRRRVTAKGQSGGSRWAAEWWNSVEAMLRLESQWRMWEEARKNPGELSAWMINHLDVHMGVLLAIDGPFATSSDENRPGESLPYQPPPNGMFASDLQAERRVGDTSKGDEAKPT